MTWRVSVFEAAMILDGAWELTGREASEEGFVGAAQLLIDTGLAWHLQGRVGRICRVLISAGDCPVGGAT
jgi:hypothetical protein